MGFISRVYRGTNDIDYPKITRPVVIVSIVLVVISLGSVITRGVNLSLDFEGGSVWEIPSQDFTADQAAEVMDADGVTGDKYQVATTAEGGRILRVQGQADSVQRGSEIAADLAEAAGLETGEVTVNIVGPSWGDDITRQARNSLIVFMALVAAYITFRLEGRMAFSALVAVLHDIIITVGFYSVFQLQIAPATVISFLTILGFSLYDTIVVYDRVQENAERYVRTGEYTYSGIMRRSLNQVTMRSLNTTITTILPIISMLVVGKFVFGQQTLADFSLALLIGLVAGMFSSLFVAAPLTAWLKEREPRWKEVRRRLEAKGVDVNDTRWHGTSVSRKTRVQ